MLAIYIMLIRMKLPVTNSCLAFPPPLPSENTRYSINSVFERIFFG